MTRRWLDEVFSSRRELRPARALRSPTWLFALAVLGVNDHLLKGAGLLPGALTGKLSDFAGMLVAPALLAALLGVTSRRGLLHCHIAVGLVFALINLSPACADAWSWLMGLVGFPWTITVDPTDLLALPALALGWRALVPAMRPVAAQPASSVSLSRWPTRPEFGAAALGSLLCVATSDTDDGGDRGDEGPVDYQDFEGDVYLHNSHAEHDIVVRVRDLRPDVEIDCFNVQSKPGVLFSEALFGEGQTWSIPPGANAPARADVGRVTRECYAVLLTSDTIAPTVLFWSAGDVPLEWIPGQHSAPGQYLAGAVELTADDDGQAEIAGSQRPIVFPQRNPGENAYLPGDDAARVAWSDPPSGVHRITELELGSDGCAAFDLDDGLLPRFYFCTPLTELPFAAGQYVSVDDQGDLLVLSRAADPDDPTPVGLAQVAASRGNNLPVISGATLAAKPVFDTELGPDPSCGTVAQPQEFSAEFGGEIVRFLPGEQVELDDGANHLTIFGVHAERRIILAPDCAEGPDTLGDDLELVYVWADSQQQP
ncbi:hypothetical protein SAMN02745121_03029 [Nannocystis exedens]|uniref:Uncharacterized protein n=1 Tax=Nannocystis exedens TaxID=54 RepID=A0A1I1XRP1_9BACT|nr:hypothetical protein [Nannocystis exedens]PCC73244.1 hypothetical protein NAEX_06332 [Nannocystis exedens]SFE09964.1 hypothetical protein SAMN02745121_03029 [Nannocystis exedens]